MTNLQAGSPRLSASAVRQIWLWFPIGAGAVLALALAFLALMPLWVALRRDSERLQEAQSLASRLEEERLLARRLVEQEEKATTQRQNLIRLISGNGDISTFLAKLDQLAKASGVQLDLFEPALAPADAAAKLQGGAAAPGAKPAKPAPDPLEAEGLQSQAIVLAARADFPQLLAFLRQMEALNVLVVQSDLELNLEPRQAGGTKESGAAAKEPVRMKMALKLYSKSSQDKPATPPPAAMPAGTTPAN
jgi:type IV pilus assembly protein PilO